MPHNRLPRVMKHYSLTGRRNHGRPLKRLLDTWDWNGSTSGPTPWQIYDDDDDDINQLSNDYGIRSHMTYSSPTLWKPLFTHYKVLDSKLSPCSECRIPFLGDSPAFEFYMPTFWNTPFHLHRQCKLPPTKMEWSVPKRRHIKFKRQGINPQKKGYKITSLFKTVSSQ